MAFWHFLCRSTDCHENQVSRFSDPNPTDGQTDRKHDLVGGGKNQHTNILNNFCKVKKTTNTKTHTKILTQSNTPNTRELTKVKVQTFNFKHFYLSHFLDSECIFLVFEEHSANSEI